ncbi:MAG: DUF1501 domain-containing protein [Chthoniobacterales bacterium]
MNPSIPPSRRQFIRRCACAALGTTALASTVWNLRSIRAATANNALLNTPGDYKALVCLFLYGGNDANNLIVPTNAADYASYAAARQGLALPQASLLPISPLTYSDGRTFGLHPSFVDAPTGTGTFPGLQSLFNSGKLAVVNNVGTLVAPVTRAQYLNGTAALPPQLFSHNDQSVHWQTSVPDQPPRTGWGGRMADLLITLNGSAQISMSISLDGTNTFQVGNQVFQYQMSPYGVVNLSGYSGTTKTALDNTLSLPHQNLFENEFSRITRRSLDNSALLSTALNGVNLTTFFPSNNYLADQLKMIAKMIAARTALGMNRQIFFCAVGGYDTHGDQLTAHANLLGELNGALASFYQATVDLGVANQVTTFTASDFGRTFPVNGGAGSDHGWGNHQLVLGGTVRGNDLYGRYPVLSVNGPDDTGVGRWIPTISVDEYSATLAKWFGVSPTDMSTVFPNLSRFAQPDLGFLS